MNILLILTLLIIEMVEGSIRLNFHWVRHGETSANRDGLLQGHSDYPLTENGEQGAILIGRLLKNMKWHSIFVSDLGRAQKTARILLSESDSPILLHSAKTTKTIREKNFGVRENMPRSVTEDQAKEIFAKKNGLKISEVENNAEVHTLNINFVYN